jgi:hypothetical protein
MLDMLSVYPELTRPLRESRVVTDDGKRLSIERLAYVYDRLPEEVKIDFDKLKDLAGIKDSSLNVTNNDYITGSNEIDDEAVIVMKKM